jgi:Na+/proline symporter
MSTSIIVFIVFSILLIVIGNIASKEVDKKSDESYFLNNRSFGKYLISISAAITGNTGFIITGAVALGYFFGMSSLVLPLAWLLGDIIFWLVFPSRLNNISRKSNTSTIAGYLSAGLTETKNLRGLTILIVTLTISFYTAVQWIAAGITFSTFFELQNIKIGILISGLVVLLYSFRGGLKASVWTDIFQAVFVTLLIFIIFFKAYQLHGSFDNFLIKSNEVSFGFMDLTNNYTAFSLVGFILGWAFASIGFGLSQPQVISRYFAGESPKAVRNGMIIYLFFLQFTWLGLTFFGVFVRVLIPELGGSFQEAQTALPEFARQNFSELTAAIIITGMFAVISSTADSFLIATANSLKVDIFNKSKFKNISNSLITLAIGIATILIALLIENPSVEKIARNIVTLLGGMIGPAVLIKSLALKHNSKSLTLTIITTSIISLAWWIIVEDYGAKYFGTNLFDSLTPTFFALIVGVLTNYLAEKKFANAWG